LVVFAGRQTNVNLEEGDTGHDRLLIWREGFAEMVRSPIFGTGMNSYPDVAGGVVAHNSFVHAYTELGIVGGTLFYGLFYFSVLGLFTLVPSPRVYQGAELAAIRPYLLAMLTAYGVGLLSSSRCYEVPTYTVVGLAAVYIYITLSRLPNKI